MRIERALVVIAIAIVLVACDDDDGPTLPSTDGGERDAPPTDAPPVDGGIPMGLQIPWLERGDPEIAPPRIPWLAAGAPDIALPAITPCPAGWRVLLATDELPARCDPWPAASPDACAAIDEAHLVGERGCARLGRACPTGTWPADLPSAARHVDDDATPGGDGSAGLPFRTIAEALAEPGPATIALARGTYRGAITLGAGITLRGACAAETTITTDALDETAGVIEIAGPDVMIEDVRVADAPRMGIVLRAAAATLRGIVVERVVGRGVLADAGSALTIDRMVVREVSRLADGTRGRGIVVGSSTAIIRHVAIADVFDSGIYALAGATTTIESSSVSRVRDVGEPSLYAMGISGAEDCAMTVRRVLVEDVEGIGIVCGGAGCRTDVEDLVVRRVSRVRGSYGVGIFSSVGTIHAARVFVAEVAGPAAYAGAGSTLELRDLAADDAAVGAWASGSSAVVERAVIHRAHDRGLYVTAMGSLVARDTIVRDSGPTDGDYGAGIEAVSASQLEVERVAVTGALTVGIYVVTTPAVLRDISVHDVLGSTSDFGIGIAIEAEPGGDDDLTIERALIAGVRTTALQLRDVSLRIEDVVIRDVVERGYDGDFGSGIDCAASSGSIDRATIERCRTAGLGVARASALRVSDLTIAEVRSEESTGKYGRGIEVNRSDLELSRARIERVSDAAVLVIGDAMDETPVVLRDLAVRDIRGRALDLHGGRGLFLGGATRLERVLVERARDTGVAISGGRLEALDLVVRSTLVQECEASTCAGSGGGRGVAVFGSGTGGIARFAIESNALVGVQLAGGGELDLFDGIVAHNLIGVNLQVPGFAIERLSRFVTYDDNQVTVDYRSLGIPASADPGS